jgi:hypothetical protein
MADRTGVEVVSGPLAAILERIARNAEPLVPSTASSGGVPRSSAHTGHAGDQAVDGSGQPAPPPTSAEGRLVGDRVDLSHGDEPTLVLYGPPSADRARSLPEPGLAAERLHQLVQRLQEMDRAAAREAAGRPGGALGAGGAPATPNPPGVVPDASTLALAGAFAAPAPQLAGPPVTSLADRLRRRRADQDGEAGAEADGDPAGPGDGHGDDERDDAADGGSDGDPAGPGGGSAEPGSGRLGW